MPIPNLHGVRSAARPSGRAPVRAALVAACFALAAAAHAQTTVTDAWIRGTVPQQTATGMYATLRSAEGGRLVAASSPLAGAAEIHEMTMHGSTMHMRPLADGLELPAGQAVELKPGGYHVMLLQLKEPLRAGATVPVTLVVEHADRRRETLELQVPVRSLAGGTPPAPATK
jgi:copper(I)-binding protein